MTNIAKPSRSLTPIAAKITNHRNDSTIASRFFHPNLAVKYIHPHCPASPLNAAAIMRLTKQ